jgi:hypothetical protein
MIADDEIRVLREEGHLVVRASGSTASALPEDPASAAARATV